MAKKIKTSNATKIDAVRHKDKRKNIPTEELRDFIVRLSDGHGPDDPLNLIVEVSGQKDGKIGEEKAAKVATAPIIRRNSPATPSSSLPRGNAVSDLSFWHERMSDSTPRSF